MTIAARKITTFVKTIAALADAPALGSSALLKAWFDSSPEELRIEINGVIDDLLAVAPGASGADNIGSAPIAGVTGTTAYAQLVSLKALIDTVTTSDGLKAPLSSPIFTGTPSLPTGTIGVTQSTSDNSTKLATTAYVKAQSVGAGTGTVSGAGTPNGVVTPTAIGQLYTDTNTGLIYTATALTNTSWIIQTPYSSMTQQAIINAAMEIWQQGTTFTNPALNAYTADMWSLTFGSTGTLPTTIIHSQATLTAGELFNSKYAYNINVNSAGSGFGVSDYYRVHQRIEFGTSKLCGNGKKITVSFYAKSNIAGKRIAVGLQQVYGTGGSPSSGENLVPTAITIRTLSSTMSLYTFTFTTNTLTSKTFGTNNDDYLQISIYEMWGTTIATNQLGGGTAETFVGAGDITFTEVVVNVGDTALPYQPKSYNEELHACENYLYLLTAANATNSFMKFCFGQATSATTATVTLTFPNMRKPPVLSTSSPSLFVVSNAAFNASFGVSAITAGSVSNKVMELVITCASGLVAGNITMLTANGNNAAYLMLDARL